MVALTEIGFCEDGLGTGASGGEGKRWDGTGRRGEAGVRGRAEAGKGENAKQLGGCCADAALRRN